MVLKNRNISEYSAPDRGAIPSIGIGRTGPPSLKEGRLSRDGPQQSVPWGRLHRNKPDPPRQYVKLVRFPDQYPRSVNTNLSAGSHVELSLPNFMAWGQETFSFAFISRRPAEPRLEKAPPLVFFISALFICFSISCLLEAVLENCIQQIQETRSRFEVLRNLNILIKNSP